MKTNRPNKKKRHDNLGKKNFYQKGKIMQLNSHTIKH